MSRFTKSAPGISTIGKLRSAIKTLSIDIREKVATKAADYLTGVIQADFDAGRTVFGETRKLGKHGDALTLTRTGRTRKLLAFKAINTIVRAHLGTKYSKYLVGRYGILPSSQTLPTAWRAELERLVREAGGEALR